MTDQLRILIVDDDIGQAEMALEFLRVAGFHHVDHATCLGDMWQYLGTGSYDVLLLDYMLPDGTGLEALPRLLSRGDQMPVIMVTGHGDERIAAQAIQCGAAEYLLKSGDYLLSLPALIYKTIRAYRLQRTAEHFLEQYRYQALLLNNVRDAIVGWDLEGRITYWNPAAVMLFGWIPSERVGLDAQEVYLSAFDPPIITPQEGNTIGHHIERQCVTKSRQTIWVSSRITTLYDAEAGNRLIGYMDVSHDITKRKEVEQALRAERNFVSTVLDTVGALVVVFDQEGRVVRFNRACENITGYSFAEVRGKYFWDLFIPVGEVEQARTLFRKIQFGEFPNENENYWVSRHGKPHLITWKNTALTNGRGRVEYVIGTGIDITERRQMEAQIQAAQTHLIQATRLAMIGEMASGVAHQINNPLTTIIAETQLLMGSLDPTSPGFESAGAIEQAGWRLQEAVQRLVEFSRPAVATLESLSIATTIERALLLVGAHIEAVGVKVVTGLAEDLPTVRGNARQLEDLWVNLLLLARDALVQLPGGGRERTIWIRASRFSTGFVAVQIRDNGLLIPPEQVESIFEPNFTGSTNGRGAGLEPSICREIVRQHGGRIEVDSNPVCDTIFRILLPIEEQPVVEEPALEAAWLV